MLNTNIFISNRAFSLMMTDISRYPNVEAGGLILGIKEDNIYYVIEAIEAGDDASRSAGTLLCDEKNMIHMISTLVNIYDPQIDVIGVWHKHNNCNNPPFSDTDMELHKKIQGWINSDVISILFQKIDDSEYKMKVFFIDKQGSIIEKDFLIMDINNIVKYRFGHY
ncbi:MAG: hypothetical protein Q4D45_05925 [Lachnospiraceae bacterium]|nr:hypothetical protein [Lachnospiraceae bacterium]